MKPKFKFNDGVVYDNYGNVLVEVVNYGKVFEVEIYTPKDEKDVIKFIQSILGKVKIVGEGKNEKE